MATKFFAFATGLFWSAQGQMTEIPDPMYGCTDGAEQPAFQIIYPNRDPISCGTQISMEVAQDQPLLIWPQAIDYYADCLQGDDVTDCVFAVMLINNDGALDGFCEDGGICNNPIYHHVLANMNADDVAAGIIPPGGEVVPPTTQTGPTHEKVDYFGPDPFAPGLVSPLDFRFHYSYVIFAQQEYVLFDNDAFPSGASLADIMEEYNLTPVEQIYFVASIDGCDDGEDVCQPCPETNSVYFDEANSPDQCTDLCGAPNYLGFPMLPEFVEPCFEVCGRCENFEAGQIISWSTGIDYASISVDEGEAVTFEFTDSHDLWQFADFTAYEACDFSRATQLADREDSPYTVVAPAGNSYYGCSVGSHCLDGQNIELVASAADTVASEDSNNETLDAGASAGIAIAAVVAVAATVAGVVKYRKPASNGGHVQLLNASTLSELDDEIAGASVASFHIEPSVASV